jgi:RNA polymerase sigma factor (sigma-70 family)
MSVDVAALYRAHGDVVLRRATAILGNVEDAREVLQDLFVSLVKDPTRFKEQSSPVTFLYAATTHRCLRRLRDKKNRGRLVDEQVKPFATDTDPARGEQLAILRNVMAQLPDDLAAVATYVYVDGLSHDEAAPLLGCSRRQVGNLLERFHERAKEVVQRLPPRPAVAAVAAVSEVSDVGGA